jgi:hypothetical protein
MPCTLPRSWMPQAGHWALGCVRNGCWVQLPRVELGGGLRLGRMNE